MAWWVVVGHAIQVCGIEAVFPRAIGSFLLHGSAAVNVFIILSGFVITNLIVDKREPYRLYILRRGFRIVPVYFFCLLLAILARPAFEFAYTAGNWATSKAWAAGSLQTATEDFSAHLLLHLGLLHGVVPDSFFPYSASTLLGPAWSISLEWQFYLVAPLVVYLLRFSLTVSIATIAFVLGTAFAFRSGYFGSWQFPSMLLLSMPFFLLGMLCRLSLDVIEKFPIWCLPLASMVAAFLLPMARMELLIWGFFLTTGVMEGPHAQGGNRLVRFMTGITASRPLIVLGKASYSTYLLHMPLWSIVIWGGNQLFGLHGQRETIWLVLISMAALVPLSLLLYEFLERPFIRLGASIGSLAQGKTVQPPTEQQVSSLQVASETRRV